MLTRVRPPTALMAIGISAICGIADARVETVVYSFNSVPDGNVPGAGLISDRVGHLYGTTEAGGQFNQGAVFELTPPTQAGGSWAEAIIYSFGSVTQDGQQPTAGLVRDRSGRLYGTTEVGGQYGYGSVFELSPPTKGSSVWKESIIYSFPGGIDGYWPTFPMVVGSNGRLYGVTGKGGKLGQGTAFELAADKVTGAWRKRTLHNFGSNGDGSQPSGGLIVSASGALLGCTWFGGEDASGTVFKLTPPGGNSDRWTESIAYSFKYSTDPDDGGNPSGGLAIDSNGALYGATVQGGADSGGTVFQLTPPQSLGAAWTEAILNNFGSSGTEPWAGVALNRAGNVFGTTKYGGIGGQGVVFELQRSRNWQARTLYNFQVGIMGFVPEGELVIDARGNIFGTTYSGGNFGFGAVYELPRE